MWYHICIMVDVKILPDDAVVLKQMLLQYSGTIDTLTEKNEHLTVKIEHLTEQNRLYRDKLFGRKSEKLRPDNDPGQPSLFDELEVTCKETPEIPEETTVVKSHTRVRGRRLPLPDNLPRRDVVHDLPEEEKQCACGHAMEKIGEEVSEKLHYVPATTEVERHIRLKYACKHCEGTQSEGIHPTVRIAPPAPAIIPKSFATPGLLAHILTAKFEDALPFYRQEKQFARIGVELSRTTMCRWAENVYDSAKPLLARMKELLRAGPLLGLDETTVQVHGENGKEDTSKSYMWVARGGPPGKTILWFQYDPGRSGRVARDILGDYGGNVQTDGYAGYDFLDENPAIRHAGCWAHARRKFDEAARGSKNSPSSMKAMGMIRKLYRVENEAHDLDADARLAQRKEKSQPITTEFFAWLEKKTLEINPASLMGKAVGYTFKQKSRLLRFLEDGDIPLDNNLVENAIRPFVVGRKNWLFSGSPDGAEASAGLYSLIETAKAADLDPYWCLRYILEKLPTAEPEELDALLPCNITRDMLYRHFIRG
jgi:transposase